MYTFTLADLIRAAIILLSAGICIGVWAHYCAAALHHDHNKRGQRR
jgi:hypothetical protein